MFKITKRSLNRFISTMLATGLLLVACAVPSYAAFKSSVEELTNESLDYSISFWVFTEVAKGTIRLEKMPDGSFTATAEGASTGVADYLLKGRKDVYSEHLVFDESKGRFVTLSFEKTVDMRGKIRRNITAFDYKALTMSSHSWGAGKKEKRFVAKLEPGVSYDGPLAIFYNMRMGGYGALEPGRTYRITTFPKKDAAKTPEVHVRVGSDKEALARYGKSAEGKRLLFLKVDREAFGSKTGNIEVLLKDKAVPEAAIVRDILFFGDITGRLGPSGQR